MDESNIVNSATAHDGGQIRRLRLEKGWTQAEAARHLEVSTSTLKRVEKQQTSLDVAELASWAVMLGVDARDLLAEAHKDLMPGVQLEIFHSEARLDGFLLDLEAGGLGRVGIFNTFPSLVYRSNGCVVRGRRLAQLLTVRENIEYYPLTAVLEFAFSVCGAFSTAEKTAILDKMIAAFSDEGHMRCQLNVVDAAGFGYPRQAPDCEIILDTDQVVLAAPIYRHAVLIIRSSSLAKTLSQKITRRSGQVLYTARAVKLLRFLREALAQDLTIEGFVGLLQENKPKLARLVVDNLNPALREKLWGR